MKIEKYPEEKIAKIYTSNHDCYANNYDNNNNQVLDIRIEVDLKKIKRSFREERRKNNV